VTPTGIPSISASSAPAEIPDFDLTDTWLRAAGCAKWTYPDPDVVPAWVAEMDVRPCPAVAVALHEAVERGVVGYPGPDRANGLPEATVGFLAEAFGWDVDPDTVVSTGDVMAGILLALTTLCDPGPVIVPVPSYPPFLEVVPASGRILVTVPCTTDGGRPVLDLEAIDGALAAGARTVILAQPHNPLGRAFTAEELTGLRDVVLRHGARVISDEIHSPLVLPGARHLPYATLEGTAEHTTTLFAASKAWNLPGLKCAQILAGTPADLATLRGVPLLANHGVSPLGIAATIAAYRDGGPWLSGLIEHLAEMRILFGSLLTERLPTVRWTPMEATYLAWLDASGTGVRHPAQAALERGRVMVSAGPLFGPGYPTHVRVNLGTSAERLRRVVDGLALAWAKPGD
jgi:cystathionine beta-lyase